jgi:6-phosphogluconolactonase (cycloisomerase 2 family)
LLFPRIPDTQLDGNSRLKFNVPVRSADAAARSQEKKGRMRKRFTWVLGALAVVGLGLLLACSAKYSTNNNGLVVVPSQGSAVVQSFSLDLGNGHIAVINNVNGPPTPGIPTSVVLDPTGNYAYVIVQENAVLNPSSTGVAAYTIGSDGKLSNISITPVANPVGMVMDSKGKFLFVANGSDGTITVLSIGSNGGLTQVGKPVPLPAEPGGLPPSAAAVGISATVYPIQFAFCSGGAPPTTENLYVADNVNYFLLNYSVSSSGNLTLVPFNSTQAGIPTGTNPAGVAVDSCNRFVYVSNAQPNTVSAYTICHAVSIQNSCPTANYSLQAVTGSPFPTGDVPGPLIVDPYGKFLYVLDTGSNQISGFQISSATGSLTAFTGAPVSTNLSPTAIAIRSDDTWMFVSNLNSANISQYAISPATGALIPEAPTSTFNYPSGVAVK